MAATELGTVTVPVFTEYDGQRIDLGTRELTLFADIPGGLRGPKVGDRVRVTKDDADGHYVGRVGVITQVDPTDDELPYLVQPDDGWDFWVTDVELAPSEPRVFHSGDEIPADVKRVKIVDGTTVERTHNGRGWQYTVKADGTPLSYFDLEGDGWSWFSLSDFPLTEIVED